MVCDATLVCTRRLKNNGRLLHRMVHDVSVSPKPSFSWTTRNVIDHRFKRHITREGIKYSNVSLFNHNTHDRQNVANILASILPSNTIMSNRPKAGRPKTQL